MKQYYYFVTSLMELSLYAEKSPVEISDFVGRAQDELSLEDYDVFKDLLYIFDSRNLATILEKKDGFIGHGIFSNDELEEEVKIPMAMPEFMRDFLDGVNNDRRSFPENSLLDELMTFYYDALRSSESKFIRDYSEFEFNLRNVLAGLNARKFELNRENIVLHLNDNADEIISSNAQDFGIALQYDWLLEVVNLYRDTPAYDLEFKLDELRISMIDHLLQGDYFSRDQIFGYFIKLVLVNRWTSLKEQDGAKIFEDLTENLIDQTDLNWEL